MRPGKTVLPLNNAWIMASPMVDKLSCPTEIKFGQNSHNCFQNAPKLNKMVKTLVDTRDFL